MEKIISTQKTTVDILFNSQLETGVRTLILLNAVYPMTYDLTKLTWLDHLVVHTGDIDGPESLHPNVPQRSGEILVRRRLIENGLILMRRLNLISAIPTENGISYQTTDEAYRIVGLMRASYAVALKNRAKWIAENICVLSEDALHNLITEKLGRWQIEFQEKPDIKKDLS